MKKLFFFGSSSNNRNNNVRSPPLLESAINKPGLRSKSGRFQLCCGESVENEFGHQSPRRLAQNVIEKLMLDPNFSITTEDIYGGSVDGCYDATSLDIPSQTRLPSDETINDHNSNLSHMLTECEFQIHQLQSELQDLAEERDQMREKVMQYEEENMLLHSQVNMLKEKMEALEEDVLFKDGQPFSMREAILSERYHQ